MMIRILLICASFFLLSCDKKQVDDNTVTPTSVSDLSLEELIINARQNTNIGNYEKAIELYQAAAQRDSMNPIRLHDLADAQMDYYLSQKALKTMEEAAERFPGHIPTRIKLAETYFILTQYKQSIATVGDIINENPNVAEAHFLRGMNYYELEQVNAAITNFQKATELDADHKDAWLMLGTAYTDVKNDLALQCFDNVLLIDPEAVEAMHNKAFHFQNTGRLEKAKAIYREINEKNPQYTDAYFNTGLLYLEQDSLQKAMDHFFIVTKIEPDYAMGYYYQGYTLERMKRPKEAIKKYEEAVRLVPDFVRANQNLKYLKALHPE